MKDFVLKKEFSQVRVARLTIPFNAIDDPRSHESISKFVAEVSEGKISIYFTNSDPKIGYTSSSKDYSAIISATTIPKPENYIHIDVFHHEEVWKAVRKHGCGRSRKTETE